MNNGYIAVLDSGIGGFSCLISMAKRLKGERFLYFGDNKNAPYGGKSVKELFTLTQKNLAEILKYDVKAIVCGCNTLSASVLPEILTSIPVPIFGVYPPVEMRRGKTLLFATPVTCAHYSGINNLSLCPLQDLACEIEHNKFSLSNLNIEKHLTGYNTLNPDTIILGCTHYFFVRKQFINHFCPQNVLSGEENTADRLYKTLKIKGQIKKRENFTVDFIGDNAEENYNFYNSVVKNIIFNK